MKKAVVKVILSLCLALSLTACGSNQGKDISSQNESLNTTFSDACYEGSIPNNSVIKVDSALAKTLKELNTYFYLMPIPGKKESCTWYDYLQYTVVKIGQKSGIVDLDGNILIPIEHDNIYICFEGIVIDGEVYSDDLKTHSPHEQHDNKHMIYYWDITSNQAFQMRDELELVATSMHEFLSTPAAVQAIEVKYTFEDGKIKNNISSFVPNYGFTINEQLLNGLLFDCVHEFSDELAAVKKDKLWGYIDESGAVVIDFQFADIADANIKHEDIMFKDYVPYDFSNGYACVWKDGEWGYIDKTGNEVTPFLYNIALPVYENRAWVHDYDKGWHVIDVKNISSNGESSVPISSEVPAVNNILKDNQALAKTVSELKPWNIEAIPGMLKSETGFDYSQYTMVSKNNKKGIADYEGNILLPVKYDKIELCYEGIVVDNEIYSDDLKTHSPHGGHGLEHPIYVWDTVSNRPFDLYVESNICDVTRDNSTPCVVEEVKMREIQKNGYTQYDLDQFGPLFGFMKDWKLITNFEYYSVHEFSDGLAAVRNDCLWGYINEDGKVAIDFQFDDILEAKVRHEEIVFDRKAPYDFSNGYAGVCKGGKWGYIDKTGKPVTKFIYNSVVHAYKSKAWVCTENKNWQLIDVGLFKYNIDVK